ERLTIGSTAVPLKNVRRVVLRGTDGDDTFSVSGWGGDATFDGGNGFDSATVNFGGGGPTTLLHSGTVGRGPLTGNGHAGGGAVSHPGPRHGRGGRRRQLRPPPRLTGRQRGPGRRDVRPDGGGRRLHPDPRQRRQRHLQRRGDRPVHLHPDRRRRGQRPAPG